MFNKCPKHPEFTKRAGTWDSEGTFTPTQPKDPELTANKDTLTLIPGQSTISIADYIYYSGDGVLTYESSKPSVATVSDDGTINVISLGTTTITVSASKTANYNAASTQIQVTVRQRPGSGSGAVQKP